MTGRVQGKVALVTGAASGIGLGCAERLAEEGAAVFLTDLQVEAGEAAAAAIRDRGGEAVFLQHDVASEEAWARVIGEVRTRKGGLDILVNNAGVAIGGPIVDTTLEAWRRLTSINIDGVFLGIKHGLPLMREGGRGGSIINMSSIAGLKGIGGQAGYSATKGAVRLLSKAVAMECANARDGVRVNSVHPGLIDTPIYGAARERLDEMSERLVPLGVKGEVSDIASAVLWLASDESRYVTATEVVVDGGFVNR